MQFRLRLSDCQTALRRDTAQIALDRTFREILESFSVHHCQTSTNGVLDVCFGFFLSIALRHASWYFETLCHKIHVAITFNLAKDKPNRDDLLAVLMGPSGNLRAPTLRKGKKLLVGFDPTAYTEVFG